jgi:eukaryotic-like serine/threonine-protein kinase
MTTAGPLVPGSVFAERFRIERPLAEGGMGQLYVVTNLATSHPCALKLLSADGCYDDELRARFLSEARNTPSDASDHIVKVLDAGVERGRPWIAMELLDGATLQEHVTRHGALSRDELRSVFAQLCHGLAAAHARGVVHRDLKPDNVFLQLAKSVHGGVFVKVLDFGVAKALDPGRARGTASIAVGTQGWWAPEQVFGGGVSPATDVWALGLLAYWCATGKAFLDSGMPQQPMLTTASSRAQEQGVAERLPEGFDAWFAHCVTWEPTGRFRDASAAWRALDGVLTRAQTPPIAETQTARRLPDAPPTRTTRPSSTALLAVGAMAFLTTVGIGWWLLAPSKGEAPTQPRPVPSETTDLHAFLRAWSDALETIPAGENPSLEPFYAPLTRFRGSANAATPPDIERYWQNFFRRDNGSLRFDWSRSSVASEVLGSQDAGHSACRLVAGDDQTVTLVRVHMTEDAPHPNMPTTDGSRCRHIEGNYLLRLRRANGAWRICHDTISQCEAICPSCPAVDVCRTACPGLVPPAP